jgi:hypothetical protein
MTGSRRSMARFVVDTNVPLIANDAHGGASALCRSECRTVLEEINQGRARLCIDSGWLILKEYQHKLRANQPGIGSKFLKWALTNLTNSQRVERVKLTPRAGDPTDFEEVPPPLPGVSYDPPDRKFLAVAAAHPDRPPILQGGDSKWWAWVDSLKAGGVDVRFLCPEFEAKYKAKMGV